MTVKQQEQQIGNLAREVVLKRASIVAVIAVVLNFAEAMGWVVPNVSATVQSWVGHGFDLAAFVGAAFYVRAAVTPADPKLNPTSTNGTALVEAHAYEVPAEALIPTQPTYITMHVSNPPVDNTGAHSAPVEAAVDVPPTVPEVAAEAALPNDAPAV